MSNGLQLISEALPAEDTTASTENDAAAKSTRRARNDQKWDSLKEDIYRMYMADDLTLQNTMRAIAKQHDFKARYS
jgi:hypothetical protein